MKKLTTVFSLGSLACEFQMVYILLSVGGSTLTFYSPELVEKLQKQCFSFRESYLQFKRAGNVKPAFF